MLIPLNPLSLLQATHIQLQNVNFFAQQTANIRSCPSQIAMHKLFDVCSGAGPHLKHCAVFADQLHGEAVDHFASGHQSSTMEYSERSQLLEFDVFEAVQFFFVVFGEFLNAVNVAQIMFYFLFFCCFEVNTDVRFCSFLEILNLNVLILMIDQQFKQFDDSPRMELFFTFLLFSPFRKLFLDGCSFLLVHKCKYILFFDGFNGFDRVHKLQHERSTSFQHPYIDIFSSSGMKFDLNLLFLSSGIKQGVYSIFYFLLKTALGQFYTVDCPWRLREVS